MEEVTLKNINKISEIIISDKEKSERFIYKPKEHKKTFWGKEKVINEHYYDVWSDMFTRDGKNMLSEDEVLVIKEYGDFLYMISDKIIYIKPTVTIKFETSRNIVKRFNTFEEAMHWVDIFLETNSLPKTLLEIK